MIIAKVNEEYITDKEAKLELTRLVHINHQGFSLGDIKNTLIQHLINHSLINQIAKKQNFDITDDETEEVYIEFLLNFDSLECYNQFLSFHSFNENQVKDYLKSIYRVKSFINKILTKEMQSNKSVINEILDDFNDCIKEEKAVRISHILIKRTDDIGEKKVNDVFKKLKDKDSFYNLALDCSDCKSNCSGGDMGFIRKGELLPEIDDVAFSLNLNQISKPFKSKYGYHIVMVTDIKKYEKKCYENFKDALIKRTLTLEAELRINKFFKEIRRNADIVIYKDSFGA